MNRSQSALLLGVLLLAACLPAQANFLDTIGNAFSDAWNTVKDSVVGVAQTVECKTVDWAAFDMTPCDEAPLSDLCTEDCKSQLLKLPGNCVDRLVSSIDKAGNDTITNRLESQLKACSIPYTITNAAAGRFAAASGALVPLVVLGASMALLELLRP